VTVASYLVSLDDGTLFRERAYALPSSIPAMRSMANPDGVRPGRGMAETAAPAGGSSRQAAHRVRMTSALVS